MRTYRNKMIDVNNIYGGMTSKEEIDAFYRDRAKDTLRKYYTIFLNTTDIEEKYACLDFINDAERNMLKNGFTDEEIEAFERDLA